jgi:probable rRNA maturation factor
VSKTAQNILNDLGFPEAELSVVIVDDKAITLLNNAYLKHEGPTNVISFPLLEGAFPEMSHQLLGDVVISIETAAKEARSASIRMEERFTELLIHGILHLVGYDHVNNAEEACEMEKKSNEILLKLQDKKEDLP